MKKRELRLPTIIGLLVVLAGLGAGLFVLRNPLRLSPSASGEEAPAGVTVSNVGESSIVVSWVTSKAVAGFVQYGESGKELDLVVSDDRDQEKGDVGSYYTHYVTLGGLKGGTKYSYKIGNKGEPYEITTAAKLEDTPTADVAYGLITTEEGNPADGAIVYLQMPGGEPASALTKASGAWVVPLATIRAEGLASYVSYDKELTELEISVQGGNLGTSLITVRTGEDSPVPTIALGKSYDFAADKTAADQDQSTESGDLTSKFSGEALAPGTAAGRGELEVLTPKDEEEVNSRRPQIIGRAPAGVEVSIEIHSSQVVKGKVVADDDGTFSYNVPTNLAPGEHSVTISATINGVLQQITQSFTVYAQGESNLPAFEATPSATLVPSPVPSATPTPTSVPSPTPTVNPMPTLVPTKTPTPTSVPTELPTSGSAWPTLLILVFGLGLLASGGVLLVK